ncbi:HET-domain-containing protein [Parathielavia appendiculata]|uniref:HET-domain-containing protein n=1 Tax=Parathielavia appendiculata TaxID=2587402 RepID=A0AAN6TWG1_9PEZI|nr:HET-domain-containing protein [Parathielavia appendiculata]
MWSSSLSFASPRSQCGRCDHPRPKYNGGYASVRTNLSAMLSNAKYAGCDVCWILSEGIVKFLSDESCGITRDDVDELRIDFNLTATKRSLEVALLGTPVKMFFYASEPTPWLTEHLPDLPVGAAVPSSTSSEESLGWAIQQLEICKRSHRACNSFSPAPLPSRVLDVFAKGECGVRLHVSQGETAPYTALSHCWGRKPFLRTLSGSLDAHRSGIPWARLPTTFQGAVEFTRKLGIRYLWIDSLCIIQDDQHDWCREATKMVSVYQNATLAISAAKSEGAYGGLYAEFPPKNRTHTVEFCPEQHDDHCSSSFSPSSQPEYAEREELAHKRKTEQIHLRLALSHPHRLLSPYHAPTISLPIFSRGWILQERFLSPRILHFGPEELTFECLETSTCQCTPSFPSPRATASAATLTPPTWYDHMLDRTARPKHYYSLTTWLEEEEEEPGKRRMSDSDLQTVWRRLVEDYTHLCLTYDKDIFPAILGMARLMQRARGQHEGSSNRYVAGLWEDALLRGDLLWHVELPLQSHVRLGNGSNGGGDSGGAGGTNTSGAWAGGWACRPARWRAPSWSWASVRAPVRFVGGEEGVEAECELVEVVCEPEGEDNMGELREGGSWLVLKGRLVPAVLRLRDGTGDKENLQPWNMVDLDVLNGGHLKNLWVDDDCKWLVGDVGRATVYCLVVGRKLPRKELLCLLLAPVPAEENSMARDQALHEDGHLYRRIGMVEVFGWPPHPVPWGWLHSFLGKGEDAVVRIV